MQSKGVWNNHPGLWSISAGYDGLLDCPVPPSLAWPEPRVARHRTDWDWQYGPWLDAPMDERLVRNFSSNAFPAVWSA